MLLYNNSFFDLGDHIGEIGLIIFVIGLAALAGTVYLIKRGFQNKETVGQLHPIPSMVLQIIGGVAALAAVNSPAYFVLNHLNLFCEDKDDIACAMLVGLGLLFYILLVNSAAAAGILIFITRKQWGIAAGILFAFGLLFIKVAGFLLQDTFTEPDNLPTVMLILFLFVALGFFILTQDKPKVDLGKCPNCGKLMAAEKVDEQLLGIFRKTSPLSFLYNKTVVSMATYEKYHVNCKCRVCGHPWSYQSVRRQ